MESLWDGVELDRSMAPQIRQLLWDLNTRLQITEERLTELEMHVQLAMVESLQTLEKDHNEHGERWEYLTSLKKPDAIGLAFAMLEESVLDHEIERDGWAPDDTCYMETTQAARKLIEDHYASKQPLPEEIDVNKDSV